MSDPIENLLFALIVSNSETGKKNYTVENCALQIRQQIGRELHEKIIEYGLTMHFGDAVAKANREVCQLEKNNE